MLSWRNVVCKPATKRVSVCWASASHANAVRHSLLKVLTYLVTPLAPLRIDSARGLGLTVLGIDEAPALCYAAYVARRLHALYPSCKGDIVAGCAWARTSWASDKVAGTRVIHLRLVSASFCRFSAL